MRATHVDLDGPVFVAEYGQQGPLLVLLHGMGASHAHWMAVAPLLGRTCRIRAVDLPGCGRTRPLGRASTLESSYRLLRKYLRLLGEPAVLVGHSMGGLLAMRLGAEERRLVQGLVLVAPAVPWGLSWRDVELPVAALYGACYLPGLGEVVRWSRARLLGPEGSVRQTLGLCCQDLSKVPKAVLAACIEVAQENASLGYEDAVYLASLRSIWRYLLGGRFEAVCHRIEAPTLLIQGDRDRLMSRKAVDRLAALRPDWQYRVMDDAGHAPQLDYPRLFTSLVRRWLGSVTDVGAPPYLSSRGA